MNRKERRKRVKTGPWLDADGKYLGKATKKGYKKGAFGSPKQK